jgi:hypothetical protein
MCATEYSRPHTSHCGPDGINLNTIGVVNGDGPGGIFMLDPKLSSRTQRGRSTAGDL